MASQDRRGTESGVLVYPQLPVPRAGPGEPAAPRRPRAPLRSLWLLAGATLGGIVLGATLRPVVWPDPRVAALARDVAAAGSATAALTARATELERGLATAADAKRALEARLAVASKAEAQLAEAAADAAKRKAALEAIQRQLAAALKGLGTAAIAGDDVRLTVPVGALFGKDDALSERGKQGLDRVAAALKERIDRQITVEGHTDETPPPLPRVPAPAPPPSRRGGGRPPAPPPAAAPPRPITQWELSASRAVAVVRYLQDVGKLDPARLAAAGYGSYRPLRRRDRAAQRRIEIVLSPRAP
jgi:chemotaxis protein MotB